MKATFEIFGDTSADADQVQHALWAKLSVAERSGKALAWSHDLLQLSRDIINRKHPEMDQEQLSVLYVAAQYGDELAEPVRSRLQIRDVRR